MGGEGRSVTGCRANLNDLPLPLDWPSRGANTRTREGAPRRASHLTAVVMPKKINTNPKAVEARARKEDKKRADQERKEQEREDALWHDDDKQLQRKAERKAIEERKRQQQLEKKQLKQALYEQEMGPDKKASETVVKKLTRAEIQQELERKKAEELKLKKNVAAAAVQEDLLTENVNHMSIEGEVGRTVDEALAILSGSTEELDKHPERRLKAAYAAYEEARLPIVKTENPNMRLSQLKQIIRKDWNKAPENPLNRPHAAIGGKR